MIANSLSWFFFWRTHERKRIHCTWFAGGRNPVGRQTNGYTNSEFVSVDSIIGYYYIKDGDIWKSFPTNRVQIIHASGGVHIVPVKPKKE